MTIPEIHPDFFFVRSLAQILAPKDAYSCMDLTNDTTHSVAGELFKLSRVQRKVARHGGRARKLGKNDEDVFTPETNLGGGKQFGGKSLHL